MKGLRFASGASLQSPSNSFPSLCLNRRLVESSRGLYKHSTELQVNK